MENKQCKSELNSNCWELINDNSNNGIQFDEQMYKAIASIHLYKHLNKPLITIYEFKKKQKIPYKRSPLRNFISVKHNSNTNNINNTNIISNNYKKMETELILDGWVVL